MMAAQKDGALTGGRAVDGTLIDRVSSIVGRISEIHHMACDELSGPGESSRIHHKSCDEFPPHIIDLYVNNFTKEQGANSNEFFTQSWAGSIWCSLGSELNVDIVSVAGPTGRR